MLNLIHYSNLHYCCTFCKLYLLIAKYVILNLGQENVKIYNLMVKMILLERPKKKIF